MNENVKHLVLDLCRFLLDEDLPEDSNLEEVLERAIGSLEGSVFFR